MRAKIDEKRLLRRRGAERLANHCSPFGAYAMLKSGG